MAKVYVQKYLWRDYGKPFHTAWQITLTADEAVSFMAMVCILITYTQAMTWRLARQAIIRYVRPIQLPDNDDPNSLLHLSQYGAMRRLLSDISSWWQRRSARQLNAMTKTSPLFGIAAIANGVVFVVMGVLIPWLLTGGLETPVVQSRLWNGCGGVVEGQYYTTSWGTERANIHVALEKYRQCWQTFPYIPWYPCTGVDGPVLDRPQLHFTYQPSGCLFDQPECVENLSEFQVYHENLTLRYYGLNVKSALRYSRRLTCSPLKLQVSFVKNEDFGWTRKESEKQGRNESSRYQGADSKTIHQSKRSPSVTINSDTSGGILDCHGCDGLHQYFQRDDGETFIIVFQKFRSKGTAGGDRDGHGQALAIILQVEDYDDSEGITAVKYISFPHSVFNDYAVVTCQEQYKFCLEAFPDRCTQFGSISNAMEEMIGAVEEIQTTKELSAFQDMFHATSIATLLQQRGGLEDEHPWSIVMTGWHPWTLDVIKWFEGTVLQTRLNLHAAITEGTEEHLHPPRVSGSNRIAPRISAKYMPLFCQSVLLVDSDYTNINFVGLLMTLAVMVAINTASHWRGHKMAAKRAAGTVVIASRIMLSTLRESWTKLSLVWGVFLSFVTSSFLAVRGTRTQPQGPELGNEGGSQIDLALRSSP